MSCGVELVYNIPGMVCPMCNHGKHGICCYYVLHVEVCGNKWTIKVYMNRPSWPQLPLQGSSSTRLDYVSETTDNILQNAVSWPLNFCQLSLSVVIVYSF